MLQGIFSPARTVLAGALVLGLVACNGSRDKLLADLQSPRPEERAQAVKKLAEQGKSEDLVLFTQAAKDPASMVRGEAIGALGKSQDARVVDLLGELLGDPDEGVQAKAAMALAEIRSDKAKAYLTLQYGRRGRATRQAIVQALKAANVPGPMASVIANESKTIWERNLQALTEGTLPERVGAAEELGKSGRPEAVNRLLPLIKDSQIVLAAAAVRGLGHAGDKRSAPAIAELLSENFPELREAACQSLLWMRESSALPKLLEVAVERSSASSLATAAIISLPPSPETDKALCAIVLEGAPADVLAAAREARRRSGCPVEPVLDKLKSTTTAAAGLQAIAGLGPLAKEALPKVVPHLSGTDAQLKRLAVEAVGAIGDPSAAPHVLKIYEQETKSLSALRADWIPSALPKEFAKGFDPRAARVDPEDAQGAQRAKQQDLLQKVSSLDEARAKQTNKLLVEARAPREVVDDANDEQLKLLAAAIRTLGLLQAEGAAGLLPLYADEASPSLRAAALVGLASLGPTGLTAAKAGLTDPDRDVQSQVAQSLAERGEEGQAAILEVVPKLGGDKVRMLEPLHRAGATPGATGILVALVKEGGADAALAAEMLGAIKSKEAVDPLVKYLDDPTGVARRDVLLALGKIGDPKAAEAIGRDLYHDSPDVRAAAAEALASLGNAAQFEPLDALKGDYYRKVREAAETALQRLSGGQPQEPRK